MTGTSTEPRTFVYADRGPVANAVYILATCTTLADHVTVHDSAPLEVEVTDDTPYALWGSGTQALWRLLCAIAYTRDEVSLYEVMSRLDRNNTIAVSDALAALCEVSA